MLEGSGEGGVVGLLRGWEEEGEILFPYSW